MRQPPVSASTSSQEHGMSSRKWVKSANRAMAIHHATVVARADGQVGSRLQGVDGRGVGLGVGDTKPVGSAAQALRLGAWALPICSR